MIPSRSGRGLDQAHPRHPRQRLAAQPSGAQRCLRPRCRRSRRARRPVSRAGAAASADQRSRRLLRHRSPARRVHQPRLPRRRLNAAGSCAGRLDARGNHASGSPISGRGSDHDDDGRGPPFLQSVFDQLFDPGRERRGRRCVFLARLCPGRRWPAAESGEFLNHVRVLKSMLDSATVTFKEIAADGATIADIPACRPAGRRG